MIHEVNRPLLKSVLVMGAMVEARDAYTGGHQWRVAQCARRLGERVGLSEGDLFVLSLGGYLHDVGKIGIPDAVLLKPGKLDQSEFDIIRTHPEIGADVMRDHPLEEMLRDIITHHHERIDGEGYPHGLSGDQISLHVRIMTIVDTFDALTSTRPYRSGLSVDRALSILEENSGSQLDPALAASFIDLARRGALDHIHGHSDQGQRMVECPVCGPVIAIPRAAQNGDQITCRVCTGKFLLHRAGDTFEVEFTGQRGEAVDLRPQVDLAPIDDMVSQSPTPVLHL